MMEYLSVKIIHLDVGGDFGFPLITIHQKFFFVVKKFFVSFSWVFKVWSFNNSIDWKSRLFHGSRKSYTSQKDMKCLQWLFWGADSFIWSLTRASFHTETAVNTLGHVNVISGCSSWSICALLGLKMFL